MSIRDQKYSDYRKQMATKMAQAQNKGEWDNFSPDKKEELSKSYEVCADVAITEIYNEIRLAFSYGYDTARVRC